MISRKQAERYGHRETLALVVVAWITILSLSERWPSEHAGAWAGEPGAKGDLVQNPGFTEGLRGWIVVPQGADSSRAVDVDKSASRGPDSASLRISAESGKRGLVRQINLRRDPAAKKYRFSVWTRCQELAEGWILRVGVEEWKGNTYVRTLQNRHIAFDEDLDWTPTNFEFDVPDQTQEMAVYVGLWYPDDRKDTPPRGGGAVWFDTVSLSPVLPREKAAPASPQQPMVVDCFYPLGERGLFAPGEPVQVVLTGKSDASVRGQLVLATRVTDFGDRLIQEKTEVVSAKPQAAFSHTLELAPPAKSGFFCVHASLQQGGQTQALASTSFCVLPTATEHDPFFAIDPNGLHNDMLQAFWKIGVGSLGFYQSWAVPREELGRLKEYMRRQVETRWSEIWQSQFQLVGYVKTDPGFHPPWLREAMENRRRAGQFPYPDALFETLGGAVEAEAEVMKDRVRTWLVCEEIDAWAANPDAPSGSGACELARYILMSRIAYQRLKKVDPRFVVGGLSVCMDYQSNPPFQLVRRMIPDLREDFDLIAIHPYCGPYNLGTDSVLGPEKQGLREVLLNTQRLQRETGKRPDLMIGEKGLSVPYHVAPDDLLEKRLANLQARNLIVAKSVSPMLYYSLHMGVYFGLGRRIREQGLVSDEERPVNDFGLWKHMVDAQGADRYRPRAAVAAYATVARALAHATDAVEVTIGPRLYTYVFRKGSGSVTALWTTTTRPKEITLNVPQAAECWDLMGQVQPLAAGTARLTISQSPQFLVSPAAQGAWVKAFQQIVMEQKSP
jgi:hypothetical protein